MPSKLKTYFPMIKTRKEVMTEIAGKPELAAVFYSWQEEQQQEFLDFCTGVRGVKMLYDFMFKEILNPESVPERISEFLSLVLGQAVTVLAVLPNDSTRIADESSLLITDIVELGDGSIVNVEVQKIGYKFPGQRSACYSSDLLLRQYKRVRSKRKKLFNYKDIKSVHTIILFERSPREFHAYPNNYLHHFKQTSDTGLELELLQQYRFIPLDIFAINLQNKGINSKLDAWLAFLCSDEPDIIIEIIDRYPEFTAMYEHAYQFCQSIEGVMEMFSKELLELDRNTVQLMIDEMQEEINQQQKEITQQQKELISTKQQLSQSAAEYQKALQRIAELESRTL